MLETAQRSTRINGSRLIVATDFDPITYTVLERFNTAHAAGLGSPRTAEPGPGSWTVVDTQNKLSISGGKLQFTLNSNQQHGDPALLGSATSRVTGRALLARIIPNNTTTTCLVGWLLSGSSNNGQAAEGAVLTATPAIALRFGGGALLEFGAYSVNLPYKYCIVLRSAGAFFLVQGGIYKNWTLLFVESTDTTATVYPGFSNRNQSGNLSDLRTTDFTGAWATDYGITLSRSVTTQANDTATQPGDAIVEHTIVAATGITQELMVRWVDDNNCWILRCDQTNSTVALIEKNGGVETTRDSKSQTWTNGTSYRLQVIMDGTSIISYVGITKQAAYSSATFNQAATGVKVSHAGTNLVVWPRTINIPSNAEMDLKYNYGFLTIGDSKTDGTGDTNPPALSSNGHVPMLVDLLNTNTNARWTEYQRLAIGGTTVASWQARIDSDLALMGGFTPTHVLINLGANDIAPAQPTLTASSWQSNLGYILDALRTKWPNCKVYVTKIWRQTDNGQMTALNDTWIPAVLATRSTWAFVGIDERTILPGSDNGVSETTDGVHPTHATYNLIAQAWKTRLTPAYGSSYTVQDHLARADGALGQTETGQTWGSLVGTTQPSIVNNQAVNSTALEGYGWVDIGLSDCFLSTTIAQNESGLRFRDSANGNGFFYLVNYNDGVSPYVTILHRVNNTLATDTELLNVSGADDNDELAVNLNLSTITVYRNGTQIGQVTDTFAQGNTRHGIYSFEYGKWRRFYLAN